MTEYTGQTTTPSDAADGRISLDDFIEAAVRGVMRAQDAQDDVMGYCRTDRSHLAGPLTFRFEVSLCPPPPDNGVLANPLSDRPVLINR